MSEFINIIMNFFFNDLYTPIKDWIDSNLSEEITYLESVNIINGDLINIALTWRQLLTIVLPVCVILVLLFLVLKTIWKLFFGKTKWQ